MRNVGDKVFLWIKERKFNLKKILAFIRRMATFLFLFGGIHDILIVEKTGKRSYIRGRISEVRGESYVSKVR
jgi:hypothetical protein